MWQDDGKHTQQIWFDRSRYLKSTTSDRLISGHKQRIQQQPKTVKALRDMAKPDQNQVLRQLPILVGMVAGFLLLLNRLLTPDLTASQARSDALGVILSALLILTGLLWQRVQPRSPDSVVLLGEEGFVLAADLSDAVKTELAWASHLLLTNTVTRSIVVWYNNQVLLRRGILGSKSEVNPGAIVKRVLTTQKPVYLVNLTLYPGKVEFDYLPENTQGVICQPIGQQGVMILAANAPRSYTQQDERWVAGIADKLGNTLSQLWTPSSQRSPEEPSEQAAEQAIERSVETSNGQAQDSTLEERSTRTA
jgi:4-amino-4-deoxy-L-arabinose transferase-like glycosyltransferase